VTQFPTKCDVEWVDAEDPLFLLYTSGSTGKPKVLLVTLDFPLSHYRNINIS
jgi:acetyl-CoA synthetase